MWSLFSPLPSSNTWRKPGLREYHLTLVLADLVRVRKTAFFREVLTLSFEYRSHPSALAQTEASTS